MVENRLQRIEIDRFDDESFRLSLHFDRVGFGMNFLAHPDWTTVATRLHSLATLIEEHFEQVATDEQKSE